MLTALTTKTPSFVQKDLKDDVLYLQKKAETDDNHFLKSLKSLLQHPSSDNIQEIVLNGVDDAPTLTRELLKELIQFAKKEKVIVFLKDANPITEDLDLWFELENEIARNRQEDLKESDEKSEIIFTPLLQKNKAKRRRIPTTKTLQYQQQQQYQQQTQVQKQSQSQQQIQAQQQIVNHEQRAFIDSKQISTLNYVDLKKFVTSKTLRKKCLDVGVTNLMFFWDSILGNDAEYISSSIRYITVEALEIIISNQTTFADGIDPDDLPEGFYLKEIDDQNGKGFILCFDHTYPSNTTPLTTRLLPQPKTTPLRGNGYQFGTHPEVDPSVLKKPLVDFPNLGDADAKKTFLAYLKTNDEKLAGEIEKSIIFQKWTRNVSFKSLLPVLIKYGAKGVYTFIQLLEKIPEKYRDAFQSAFLDQHEDWSNYLKKQNVDVFDQFKKLTPSQWAWWNELTTRQASSTGLPLNLADLFHGFKYFVHSYQDIVGEDLPLKCPFDSIPVRNMKVQLSRLLSILNLSDNPKEQAKNLSDFSMTGPYFAMRHEHFLRTFSEMELSVPNSSKHRLWKDHPRESLYHSSGDVWFERGSVKRDPGGYAEILLENRHYLFYYEDNKLIDTGAASRSYLVQEPHYSVSDEELMYMAEFKTNDKIGLKNKIRNFYRFLGKEKYIFSIERYRSILEKIILLGSNDYTKALLVILLALGSVGKKGAESELETSMESLINLSLQNPDLLMYLMEWGKAKIAFNLNELSMIARLLSSADKYRCNELANFLLNKAKMHPKYFLPAVMIYSKHSPPSDINKYFKQIEILDKYQMEKDLTGKLLILIALVNKQDHFESFLKKFVLLSREKLNHLLDCIIQSDYSIFIQKNHSWQSLTDLLLTLNEDKKEEKSLGWVAVFPKKSIQLLQNEEVHKSFVVKMPSLTELQGTVLVGSLSSVLQWYYQYQLYYSNSGHEIVKIYELVSEIQKLSPVVNDENFINVLKEEPFLQNYSPELLMVILKSLKEMTKKSLKSIFPISIFQHLKTLGIRPLTAEKQEKLITLIPMILSDDHFNKSQKISLLTIAFQDFGDIETMRSLIHKLYEVKEDVTVTALTKVLQYYPTTLDQNITLTEWAKEQDPALNLLTKCHQLFEKYSLLDRPYQKIVNTILDKKNTIKRQYLLRIAEIFAPSDNLDVLLAELSKKDEVILKTLAKLVELKYINYKQVTDNINHLEAALKDAQTIPLKDIPVSDPVFIKSLIKQIKNLSSGKAEDLSQRKQKTLFKYFEFVKIILSEEGVITRADGSTPSVKDLTQVEIESLLIKCKGILQDTTINDKEKTQAKLLLLAIFCKVMYHTTHTFPNDMQILTVLNNFLEGQENSIFLRVLAGEGKTMIIALTHALDCLLGKSVDIVTQNTTLSIDGFKSNEIFFKALGIPVSLINSQSSAKDYRTNGAHYSDVGEFSLFREKLLLLNQDEPLELESHVLALDEGDYTVRFNHHMLYRHSGATNHTIDSKTINPYEWLYPLINDFIDEENFAQDEMADRYYAELFKKRHSQDLRVKELDIVFLITLLNDAIAVKFFKENHDYCLRKSTRIIEEEIIPVSVACVMEEKIGRVSQRAEFMGHQQQLLHTRLNKLGKGIPYPFPIDPTSDPKASLDSRSLIKRYPKVAAYSGTWETKPHGVRSLLSDYPAQLFIIPPFHGDGLVIEKPEITDAITFNRKYFENSKNALDKKEHVIIVLKTIEEAEAMFVYFKKQRGFNNRKIQLCHANKIYVGDDEEGVVTDEKSEQEAIERAGQNGFITITTTMLGRGANILSNKESCCVLTNEADDECSCEQIFRRASRYGKKGRAKLIVQIDKLKPPINQQKPSEDTVKRIEQHQEAIALDNDRHRRFSETGVAIRQFFFQRYLQLKNAIPLENSVIREKLDLLWGRFLAKREKEWDEILFHFDDGSNFEDQFKTERSKYIDDCIRRWTNLIGHFTAQNHLKIVINSEKLKIQEDDKAADVPELHPRVVSLISPKKEEIEDILKLPKPLTVKLSPLADRYKTITDYKVDHEKLYCDLMLDIDGSLNITKRKDMIVFRELNTLLEEKLNHDNFENLLPKILDKYIQSDLVKFKKIAEIIGKHNQSGLISIALRCYKNCFSNLIKSNSPLPIDELRATVFDHLKVKTEEKLNLQRIIGIFVTELTEYKNSFRTGRDRVQNAEKLISDVKSIKSYNQVLEFLFKARKDALDTDEAIDRAAWFFKRNILGSRYQKVITKLREYVLTEADQDFDYKNDFSDLNQLISSLKSRLPTDEKRHPVYNTLADLKFVDSDTVAQSVRDSLVRLKNDVISICPRDIRNLYHLTVEKANQMADSMRQSRQGKRILDERCIRESIDQGIIAAKSSDDYKAHPKERIYAEVDDRLRHSKIKAKPLILDVTEDAVTIRQKDDQNDEKRADPPPLRFAIA